jgi:hypothetical protein
MIIMKAMSSDKYAIGWNATCDLKQLGAQAVQNGCNPSALAATVEEQ